MSNNSIIFFIFKRKIISIAEDYLILEKWPIFVWENNRLMIHLFLGENKFIQQAIVSTDLQKKMSFFYSF